MNILHYGSSQTNIITKHNKKSKQNNKAYKAAYRISHLIWICFPAIIILICSNQSSLHILIHRLLKLFKINLAITIKINFINHLSDSCNQLCILFIFLIICILLISSILVITLLSWK